MSLLSVRGVYENGVVRLLSPVEVKGKFDLIVTFAEPIEEDGRKGGEESHDLEEQRRKILSFAGLLSTTTAFVQTALLGHNSGDTITKESGYDHRRIGQVG